MTRASLLLPMVSLFVCAAVPSAGARHYGDSMDYKYYRRDVYGYQPPLQPPGEFSRQDRLPQKWDGAVDRHVYKDPADYLYDPQVLIASGLRPAASGALPVAAKAVAASTGAGVPQVLDKEQVLAGTPSSTIERLDAMLRSIEYDPTARIIWKSRTPQQVFAQQKGNCFEVARTAMLHMQREGYRTHLVDVKSSDNPNWHTICAFQDIDGRWSMFHAAPGFVGFVPVKAKSLSELIKAQFPQATYVKMLV